MHRKHNDFSAQFQILLKVYICVIVRSHGDIGGNMAARLGSFVRR